jgi:hypothetical protein
MPKLSNTALLQIAFFDNVKIKLDRLNNLVEQYATARVGQDQFVQPIGRTAVDLSELFLSGSYNVMADSANQIVMLCKRGGGTHQNKSRSLRDLVGSIRAAVDTELKTILSDEKMRNEREAERREKEKR